MTILVMSILTPNYYYFVIIGIKNPPIWLLKEPQASVNQLYWRYYSPGNSKFLLNCNRKKPIWKWRRHKVTCVKFRGLQWHKFCLQKSPRDWLHLRVNQIYQLLSKCFKNIRKTKKHWLALSPLISSFPTFHSLLLLLLFTIQRHAHHQHTKWIHSKTPIKPCPLFSIQIPFFLLQFHWSSNN